MFNSFHTAGLFLYPLKTSENQRFSDVFRGCRKGLVAWHRFMTNRRHVRHFLHIFTIASIYTVFCIKNKVKLEMTAVRMIMSRDPRPPSRKINAMVTIPDKFWKRSHSLELKWRGALRRLRAVSKDHKYT